MQNPSLPVSRRLGWLRVVAFLEGLSFLILLGVAMPLKYLAGQPQWVRGVGMTHGLLFMAYVALVWAVMMEKDWTPGKTMAALVASVLPFGTFWAEFRLFREP
jgi:integral membrane protein